MVMGGCWTMLVVHRTFNGAETSWFEIYDGIGMAA
jgi:hypothetical protein